jgi:hypothetical protein
MVTPADPTAVPPEKIYAALLKIAQRNNITVISDDLSDAQFKELATPSLFLIIRDETGKSPALRKLIVIRPTLALEDRNNSLARNLAFDRLLMATGGAENIQNFYTIIPAKVFVWLEKDENRRNFRVDRIANQLLKSMRRAPRLKSTRAKRL